MSEKHGSTKTIEESDENLPYPVGPPNGERFIKKVCALGLSPNGTVKNHKGIVF